MFETLEYGINGKTIVREISDERALELMQGATRDPAGTLSRMKANPYAQLQTNVVGVRIRWAGGYVAPIIPAT